MDLPEIYINTKYVATNVVIKDFKAPSRHEWDHYFDNPKKTTLFLLRKSPHIEYMLTSGIIRLNVVSQVILITSGIILDTEEHGLITKYIPIIQSLAKKLKAL